MSDPRYGAGDHELTHRLAGEATEPTTWKPFRPSEDGPESRVQSDYGFNRLDGSPSRSMAEERSFWSRTRDEIRSWFGDRKAEARRTEDVARAQGFDVIDPHDDEDDVVWHGQDNLPPR